MRPRVEFIDEAFPVLVAIMPRDVDAQAVEDMKAGYERYFARDERYALVTHTQGGLLALPARQRRAIVDWVSEPHVRERSRRLCVISVNLVETAYQRAALKAMTWLYKPPVPQVIAATPEEALDRALAAVDTASLPMALSHDEVRARLLPSLRLWSLDRVRASITS